MGAECCRRGCVWQVPALSGSQDLHSKTEPGRRGGLRERHTGEKAGPRKELGPGILVTFPMDVIKYLNKSERREKALILLCGGVCPGGEGPVAGA